MEGELFSGVSAQGMVDRLCELAVERKASDVHAEPLAEGGRIRLRRHGVMENLGYLSGRRFSSLINCFKVMAICIWKRTVYRRMGAADAGLPVKR